MKLVQAQAIVKEPRYAEAVKVIAEAEEAVKAAEAKAEEAEAEVEVDEG